MRETLFIAAGFAVLAWASAEASPRVEFDGTAVVLERTDHGYRVVLENRRSFIGFVEEFTVTLGDAVVVGRVESRSNVDPDDLIVIAPAGYWCDPCQITVNENQTGTVELFPEVGA